MSKSSQKKGAQDAGREPGRGCAWDLQILKTFQGESAGLYALNRSNSALFGSYSLRTCILAGAP